MRVGLLTTSFPRWPGDWAGGFVAEQAQWLAGAGHQVDVLCVGDAAAPDGPPAVAQVPSAPPIRVERVSWSARLFYRGGAPERLEADARSWLEALRVPLALTRATRRRRGRWDLLFAHWLVPCGVAAAVAGPGCPVTAIAHSGDVHLLARMGLTTPVAAGLVASGTRLVFVSEAVRERFLSGVLPVHLRRHIGRHSLVCPMGVDRARLRAARFAGAGTGSGPEAGLVGARPLVLFLGRLVPIKGIATLLEAAPQLGDLAEVAIAGEGPDGERLRALARARRLPIRFLGPVSGATRDRLLAAAAVVVVPSVRVAGQRTEGMPLVALEAMAAGAALVVSAVGGLAELPPSVARQIPPGDARALAAAVRELLIDRRVRQDQLDRAEIFVKTRDWQVVGPRLLCHSVEAPDRVGGPLTRSGGT